MSETDEILIHPNDVLRRRCEPVGAVDDETALLGRRLVSVMLKIRGIGLAAPQVGVSKRVVAIGVDAGIRLAPFVMVDPKVIWKSVPKTTMAEGCLSIPGKKFLVSRPRKVKVSFTTLAGRRRLVEAEGLAAKCIQHEIDHLDGVLICDLGEEFVPEPLPMPTN